MVILRNWICSFTVNVFNKDRYLCVRPQPLPSAKLFSAYFPYCPSPCTCFFGVCAQRCSTRRRAAALLPATYYTVTLTAGTARTSSCRQSLHLLFRCLCSQMPDPPHCLHMLLWRLCSQTLPPPHCLHCSLLRLCSQMPDPPHCLHLLLSRLCGHFAIARLFFTAPPPAPSPPTS